MTLHKVSAFLKQENRVAVPFRFLFKPHTSDESNAALRKNWNFFSCSLQSINLITVLQSWDNLNYKKN